MWRPSWTPGTIATSALTCSSPVLRTPLPGGPWRKLEEVLGAYALMAHSGHGSEQAVLLHARPHVGDAEQHLNGFLADLLAEGANEGVIRTDTAPEALAAYCLHALGAAGE